MRTEMKITHSGMNLDMLNDKAYVEKNIVYHLVNRSNVRPEEIFDPIFGQNIGLVYRILLDDKHGAILKKDTLKQFFNGDMLKVRRLARQNTSRLRPAKLTGLNEMVFKLMGLPPLTDEPEIAYVLTNEQTVNGAACILYPGVYEMIKERVGGPFYVIPSSVHETIIIPVANGDSPEEIKDIIGAVNGNPECISPETYLGDDPIPSTEVARTLRYIGVI